MARNAYPSVCDEHVVRLYLTAVTISCVVNVLRTSGYLYSMVNLLYLPNSMDEHDLLS